jgi:hypothetical protein
VPTDFWEKDLCKRQRVQTSAYYSVSVFGMAVILSIGTILILLDQSLEKLWFAYLNPRSGIAKQAEWTQTGMLQLHRQAVEARGIGPWDRKNTDVPVMETCTTFPGLGVREERIGENTEVEREKVPYQLVTGEVVQDEYGRLR